MSRVWRRRSINGPAQNKRTSAKTLRTAARVIARQRARAAASSAGATSASSTNPPSRAGTVKRNGCAGDGDPPARTRSVTGAIAVAIENVSLRPGAPRAVPSACSTTTVAARMPARTTGSMRIRPGPSGPGATISGADPSTTSLPRSDTLPAQASGTPPVS